MNPAALAIPAFGLVAAVVVGVVMVRRAMAEEREVFRKARAEVMARLAEDHALAPPDESGLEGSVAGRTVHVRHPAEPRGGPEAEVLLHHNVVPVGVRLVAMADGPYQKQEERAIGGACRTGDAAFDAAFLAYGTEGGVRAIAPAVRAGLVAAAPSALEVEARRLVAPLALAEVLDGGPDPAAQPTSR